MPRHRLRLTRAPSGAAHRPRATATCGSQLRCKARTKPTTVLVPRENDPGLVYLLPQIWCDQRIAMDGTSREIYTLPGILLRRFSMSHTVTEKTKLLNRVRRVRGQIEALERAVMSEEGCAAVLHLIVAARGAINGLMAEVIEDHIRLHVVDPAKDAERRRGAEELIEAVQSYLK